MSTDGLGHTIVVTGVTGMVGGPLAKALAVAGHDVVGVARFINPAARAGLEEAGVRTVTADLAADDLDGVPADADHVLHLAVSKSGDWYTDLRANVDGTARLLEHCRGAASVLHVSSCAVYHPDAPRPFDEERTPLGDSHSAMGMRTYSVSKIAAEAAARYAARRFGVPTTIARLNVPYGDDFGWPLIHYAWMMKAGRPVPVHLEQPTRFNVIHLDDIVGTLASLLAAAAPEAPTVNWANPEVVSIEEWCSHMGALSGLTPSFAPTANHVPSVVCDTGRLAALGARFGVPWRDGFARMVARAG